MSLERRSSSRRFSVILHVVRNDIMNLVPSLISLSTRTEPAICSISCLQMLKPRPTPLRFTLAFSSIVLKSMKSLETLSGDMPQPKSYTITSNEINKVCSLLVVTICSSSWDIQIFVSYVFSCISFTYNSTNILPSYRENLIAFDKKLIKICK